MDAAIVLPLALALVLGGAFVVNEWSAGGLSVAMGMGPHHLGNLPGAMPHSHAEHAPCVASSASASPPPSSPAGGGSA